jgi:hypothetical protein
MGTNINKGETFKHGDNFYVVDTIDVFDDITLIFTEDKKYIPINEVKMVGAKYAFLDLIDPSKINERDALLMKHLDYINKKYPNKKTIKEYLPSLLLNLFPKVSRLWTSAG